MKLWTSAKQLPREGGLVVAVDAKHASKGRYSCAGLQTASGASLRWSGFDVWAYAHDDAREFTFTMKPDANGRWTCAVHEAAGAVEFPVMGTDWYPLGALMQALGLALEGVDA